MIFLRGWVHTGQSKGFSALSLFGLLSGVLGRSPGAEQF